MESHDSGDTYGGRHRYRHPEWEKELISFPEQEGDDTADAADVEADAITAPDDAEAEPSRNTTAYMIAELIKDPDMTDPSRSDTGMIDPRDR